jgi:hypothetical protein
VKPIGQRGPHSQRSGLAEKNEKDGLKGALGIVFVVEKAAAHAPHQRRMSAHQRLKRCFIALEGELLEQFVIAQLRSGCIMETANRIQQGCKGSSSHDGDPRGPLMYLSE